MNSRQDIRLGLLGGSGQVGTALRAIEPRAAAPARDELDITDAKALAAWLDRVAPQVVINCAAWTNVPQAETNEAEARLINAEAAGMLAELTAARDIDVVYMSSDFVFDGAQREPYREDATPAPLSAYARSKALGETATLSGHPRGAVLRAGWIFSGGPGNFVHAILSRARAGDPLQVVNDQHGAPCSAQAVARYLIAIAAAVTSGSTEQRVFHLESQPATTWFGFAEAVCRHALDAGLLDQAAEIEPIAAAAYQRDTVQRPSYSVLDGTLTRTELGLEAGDWQRDLARIMASLRRDV